MGVRRNEVVLIVDDQTTFRQALKSILIELGFAGVEQASSGREAVLILKKQVIDCVITDWNMPGMDGLELLQWVRNNPATSHIPLMLLTANASRTSIESALQHGVNDYLIKPFTMQHFVTRLLRVLQHKGRVAPRPAVVQKNKPVIGEVDLSCEERRSSILIVDDAKENIEIAASILENDYQIKVALSGEKALEIANSNHPPSLILLDVVMPEIDGFEVCRTLQANEATRHIPVIFMTSKDQPDDIAAGLELGAVDYVVKPAHPTVLRARVRNHLRLAKAINSLSAQSARLAEDSRLREEVEQLNKHDLKSPLAAVVQITEQLISDSDLTKEQKQLVRLAANATQDALEQIDQTLDLLRMESGSYLLEPQVFDICDIVEKIAQQVELAFAGKIKILISKNPQQKFMVLGDAGLSGRILSNLLKNAAEAAPEGSEIGCQLEVVPQYIEIKIHNQGAIPSSIRHRFFEKYATAGKKNGTGIGTYTSKLYAEAQNGQLEMHTDDETGTTLTIKLPSME